MKTAIVYDRVNKWGGAERVLLTLHEMFPSAPLYTSVYNSKTASWAKVFPKVYTSFLQNFPFAKNNHELYAALMPIAFESFNFDEYDLVISVTSESAKGILVKPGTKHICYMLTPTRYLWNGYEEYFKNPILKFISTPVTNYLRNWDKVAAYRPDKIVSISSEVKKRVKKFYNLESEVIFPPTSLSTGSDKHGSNYYLVVSRLVPYKRLNLAVEAFNRLKYPLVIVGTGSEQNNLKFMSHKNIKFAGKVSEEELVKYYSSCRALIFPQEEDFGLTAVEAQSFGKPVIAYKAGGSLDTIIDGRTGVFFNEQNWQALYDAVKRFEKMKFDSKIIIRNAGRFSKERFKKEFLKLI